MASLSSILASYKISDLLWRNAFPTKSPASRRVPQSILSVISANHLFYLLRIRSSLYDLPDSHQILKTHLIPIRKPDDTLPDSSDGPAEIHSVQPDFPLILSAKRDLPNQVTPTRDFLYFIDNEKRIITQIRGKSRRRTDIGTKKD
jgi:hypothetical protein